MKIIPGKYLNENFEALKGFVLPQWDFIEMNLNALKMKEDELVSLFDVSKTALDHWKNGGNISIDKIAVLCELFGISIDQYYERDFNDDHELDDFLGLSKYKDLSNCKQYTYKDLYWLFDKLNDFMFYTKFFALGYIPLDKNENDPEDVDEDFYRHYIDPDEVDYFCQTLDMNVSYDTKDGKSKNINSVTYKELRKVADELRKDWGDDSFNHISATPSAKYKKVVMLSENIKFLKEYISKNDCKDELLKLWCDLKQEDDSYDVDSLMAKTIISNGAILKDVESTFKLCNEIFENDIKKVEVNRNGK